MTVKARVPLRSGLPGVRVASFAGVMLSAALTSVLYAGWKLLALPFAPFDLFDWTTRRLPGGAVTVGIDSMVGVIRWLGLGDTARAGKTIEQSLAVIQFVLGGTAVTTAFFLVARHWRRTLDVPAGASVGLIIGVLVLLANRSAGFTGLAGPLLGGAWTLIAFVGSGAIGGWVYRRLAEASPSVRVSAPSDAPAPAGARASVERLDRRRFLIRLNGATAVITVTGTIVGRLVGGRYARMMSPVSTPAAGRWSAGNPLPNSGAGPDPAPGTRPEFTPLEDHYRIDISTVVPYVREEDWRLRIAGLVDRPLSLSLEDLRGFEPLHQFVTLACISNPVGGDLIGTQRWTGASLQRLLPALGLGQDATHLKIQAADGFFEVVSLEQIRSDPRIMLAYAWDGVPLTMEHGFPLRIYIPDHYGMKQPKWIESIEATDRWEPGYWVVRGWDREARMKATSVIDAVGVDSAGVGDRALVPIGGIAHAGARGISKVEIRVDGGAWQEARLRAPLSDLSWVIWRFDWPFAAGPHEFTVRCVDGGGLSQIPDASPPHPSGASGLFSRGT